MAGVLIATALGASAATAAAVGGGVALATAASGSIKSFSEAGKAKKRQQQAERDAQKAMDEARKRLGVNVFEQLSIQKEPYELAREAALVTGAQALQAGVEGEERGAAATAGRVAMAQAAEQARIRAEMGQELQGIQQKVVAEEGRLLDAGMGLDLGEVAGQQQMAADAQKDRAAYMTQGFTALQQGAELGQQMAPLYGAPQNGATRAERKQRRADARNFVPYAEEQAALAAATRSSGLNESIMGGGFTQPQYQSLGFNSGASFGLPTYAQPIYTTQQ
jgi:hypothetical protein